MNLCRDSPMGVAFASTSATAFFPFRLAGNGLFFVVDMAPNNKDGGRRG